MPGSLKCWKRLKMQCASLRTMTHVWQKLWLLRGETHSFEAFLIWCPNCWILYRCPRFLEHFILNGPDPAALESVISQLGDPNRKQPQDLDKAVIGMWGLPGLVPLHTRVRGLSNETKATCSSFCVRYSETARPTLCVFVTVSRPHSSG